MTLLIIFEGWQVTMAQFQLDLFMGRMTHFMHDFTWQLFFICMSVLDRDYPDGRMFPLTSNCKKTPEVFDCSFRHLAINSS